MAVGGLVIAHPDTAQEVARGDPADEFVDVAGIGHPQAQLPANPLGVDGPLEVAGPLETDDRLGLVLLLAKLIDVNLGHLHEVIAREGAQMIGWRIVRQSRCGRFRFKAEFGDRLEVREIRPPGRIQRRNVPVLFFQVGPPGGQRLRTAPVTGRGAFIAQRIGQGPVGP